MGLEEVFILELQFVKKVRKAQIQQHGNIVHIFCWLPRSHVQNYCRLRRQTRGSDFGTPSFTLRAIIRCWREGLFNTTRV